MTRIGICDDEKILLREFSSVIAASCKKEKMQVEIRTYTSGEMLLADTKDLNLLFLDIEMPGMNGMEVARRLKEQNKTSPIVVFLTNRLEYSREAYQVNAYRYLIKENYQEEIDECIASYKRELEEKAFVEVFQDRIKLSIEQSQIMYVSANRSGSYVATIHAQFTSPRSLNQWEELLDGNCFVRAHRENIVNVAYIERIENNIVFENGELAYVSRRGLKKVNSRWREYISIHAR